MTNSRATRTFHERLIPGFGTFVAWLLLIPAVALVMIPIDQALAVPVAIAAYGAAVLLFVSMSPVVEVRDGSLRAGRAVIPVRHLGDVSPLGRDALRDLLGPGADARNFLVVRGWIQRGVSIDIIDTEDPTPRWIITTRRPVALAEAIEVEQAGR